MSCIFCDIISGASKAKIEYEDDFIIVFHSIEPMSDIHLLIVPKKHIASIKEIKIEDEALLSKIFFVAKKLGKKFGNIDYKIIVNNGKNAGQIINHIHFHFLSGDNLKKMIC